MTLSSILIMCDMLPSAAMCTNPCQVGQKLKKDLFTK